MAPTLPILEMFETLQGEGYWTGTPAYFIRLAGCDVECVWCDTKYSWNLSSGKQITIDDILAKVEQSSIRHIVVTGGEPLMHNLTPLTQSFHEKGYFLQIETSGTHLLTGEWDWITFSPKKFKKPLPEYFAKAQELKVVIYNRFDFQWAEDLRKKMNADSVLYLQPEWSKQKQLLPLLLDYIKVNPHWRLSLQTHKWLEIP